MKLYFYSNKNKELKEYEWDELKILVDLLKDYIRLPKLKENQFITEEYLLKLKNKISKLKYHIPLYNIQLEDLRIVPRNDVFNKIMNENYRFLDINLIETIKNKIKNNKDNKNDNKKMSYQNIIFELNSENKELNLENKELNLEEIDNFINKRNKHIIIFINYFDYELLENSYIRMVYYGSNKVGKDITTYQRKSYLHFILQSKPYYTRSEIINTGLNYGDIKEDDTYYDPEKLKNVYNKIIKSDFNSDILLEHLLYINDNNCGNLIRFYTFTGSYYINNYLRDTKNNIKDKLMEKMIEKMWKLILNAPKLNSEKVVYRFIDDDFFLKNLKINEIYQDNGFLSTTRNQFYDIDSEKFGYIMIKINIPANIGGFLCVESYSLFYDEEEIIFAALSKFRLIKKDNYINYYHVSDTVDKKITKKYEFNYEGSLYNKSLMKSKEEKIKEYNFYKKIINGNTLGEKIDNFYNSLSNIYNKFYLIINNKKILFYCDFYDSKDVYKDFFQRKTDKGFYIYSLDEEGQYKYFIEIGNKLYINYFMKFINTTYMNDEELLSIVSSIGYSFNISSSIINSNYMSNKIFFNKSNNNSTLITNHNSDIFNFLKETIIRFPEKYVVENFTLLLKLLKEIKIKAVLNVHDKDKLYYIYKNYYKLDDNCYDFYIYIIENNWELINELNNKLKRFFNKYNNKFDILYYFDTNIYLYEKKIIKYIPNILPNDILKEDISFKNIFKNNYTKKERAILA